MAKSQSGSPLGYVSFRGPVSTRLRATPAGFRRCSASQSSSIGRVKRMSLTYSMARQTSSSHGLVETPARL